MLFRERLTNAWPIKHKFSLKINMKFRSDPDKVQWKLKKLEEVLPVEHDGFVDGVRHEPLRGLRDVLPQLVVRTVLLLQQAFADTMRKGFVLSHTGGFCNGEMSRRQRTYTE